MADDVNQPTRTNSSESTAMTVLFALSFSHMLNDTLQSLIPAIYPVIKESYHLSYAQIGMITLVSQLSGSILQPVVGIVTDRHPMPWSLAVGMGASLIGVIMLGLASNYGMILLAVGITGIGSSIFHPESSRIARLASGGKHGLAQSLFQVGGNFGTSLGPVLAAVIIAPYGQKHVLWFTLIAAVGIVVLARAGGWYHRRLIQIKAQLRGRLVTPPAKSLPRRRIAGAVAVLVMLIFSKQVYLASMTNYS
ncbi:MAG: MFS transporter [Puniceicoccales bacterium]|jgi:FSR family fosmidomycin resistance protein-like MFS transporter|nr:MFS transporter [Puniceicoccales bacterium]